MKPVVVYRIEHVHDGHGPWRPCGAERKRIYDLPGMDALYDRFSTNGKGGGFPLPWDEGINFDPFHFFAFTSLEIMYRYITKEELKVLVTNDFKIMELKVKRAKKGFSQTAYRKADIMWQNDISYQFK